MINGNDRFGHLTRTAAIGLALCLCAETRKTCRAELTDLDLADLASIRISLPARKDESLFGSSSATYVISHDDVTRSGATTIPDLLRMVPGLQVARMEANKWAITSRGFNGRFARHMLVQVDGRTVYSPLFSGVYWEAQDMVLEDIERIEVIRGPGSTMWGANAVNGVINVVTRSAHDTLGTLLSIGIGTEDRVSASVRHGVKLAPDVYLRVYFKGFDRDDGTVGGEAAHDAWRANRSGFRLDWIATGHDTLTVQGDYYAGKAGQLLSVPDLETVVREIEETVDMSGANLLVNWNHAMGDRSALVFRGYYDFIERREHTFGERRHTVDMDFQHRFPAPRQDIVWGAGYRLSGDELRSSSFQTYADDSAMDPLFSAFAQDEVTLIRNRLRASVGSKVEHNDYTGFEFQPTVRCVLTPGSRHAIWTAVSRAVRTPSRIENTMHLERMLRRPNMEFFGSPTLWAVINGNDAYASESVVAYEAGYRLQATRSLNIDLAGFYNDYDRLQTVEPTTFSLPVQFDIDNKMKGESFGVELSADWRPAAFWSLQASYAYIDLHLSTDADSRDIFTAQTFEDDIPHHQASLLSKVNLPGRVDFDMWFRYVDPIVIEALPRYMEMDMRVCWHISDSVSLSLVGQNLLDNHHYEYGPSFLITTQSTEVERSVYAKATWQF